MSTKKMVQLIAFYKGKKVNSKRSLLALCEFDGESYVLRFINIDDYNFLEDLCFTSMIVSHFNNKLDYKVDASRFIFNDKTIRWSIYE